MGQNNSTTFITGENGLIQAQHAQLPDLQVFFMDLLKALLFKEMPLLEMDGKFYTPHEKKPPKDMRITPSTFRHLVHLTRDVLQELNSTKSDQPEDEWEQLLPQLLTKNAKVVKLWQMGIPHKLRARAWKEAIGNDLHITPELFHIFRQHARAAATNLERQSDDEDESSTECDIPTPRTMSLSRRNSRQSHRSSVRRGRVNTTARREILGHEHSVALIPIDLPRTVAVDTSSLSPTPTPSEEFINDQLSKGSPDDLTSAAGKMQAVLEAYACYRPDVGYVQGMSYLAAMFVGLGDDLSAEAMFVCLANMLHGRTIRTFYSMNIDDIRPFIQIHNAVLKENAPRLFEHFAAIDLKPEMYLYEWILTMFSQILPVRMAYRIWDCYFLHGDHFIFCTSVGLLKVLNKHLLDQPFEVVATMLTRGMDHVAPLIDEESLMDVVLKVKFTNRRFESMLKQFNRE